MFVLACAYVFVMHLKSNGNGERQSRKKSGRFQELPALHAHSHTARNGVADRFRFKVSGKEFSMRYVDFYLS